MESLKVVLSVSVLLFIVQHSQAYIEPCEGEVKTKTATPSAVGVVHVTFCAEVSPLPLHYAEIPAGSKTLHCLAHQSCADRIVWWWEAQDPDQDQFLVHLQVRDVHEKGGGEFPITIFNNHYKDSLTFKVTVFDKGDKHPAIAPPSHVTPRVEECADVDSDAILRYDASGLPSCPDGWLPVGGAMCVWGELGHPVDYGLAKDTCAEFSAEIVTLHEGFKDNDGKVKRSADEDEDEMEEGGKKEGTDEDEDEKQEELESNDDDDNDDDDDDDDDEGDDEGDEDEDGKEEVIWSEGDDDDDEYVEVGLEEAEAEDRKEDYEEEHSGEEIDDDDEDSAYDDEEEDEENEDEDEDEDNSKKDNSDGDAEPSASGNEKNKENNTVKKNNEGSSRNEEEESSNAHGTSEERAKEEEANVENGDKDTTHESDSKEENHDAKSDEENYQASTEKKVEETDKRVNEESDNNAHEKKNGEVHLEKHGGVGTYKLDACLNARLRRLAGSYKIWVKDESELSCLTYNSVTEHYQEETACGYHYNRFACVLDGKKYQKPKITRFNVLFHNRLGKFHDVHLSVKDSGVTYHNVKSDVDSITIKCAAQGWPKPEVVVVESLPHGKEKIHQSPYTSNVSKAKGDFLGRFSCSAGNVFGDEIRIKDLTLWRYDPPVHLKYTLPLTLFIAIFLLICFTVFIYNRAKISQRLRHCRLFSCPRGFTLLKRRQTTVTNRLHNEIFPPTVDYVYGDVWDDEVPLYVRQGRQRQKAKEEDSIYKELKDMEMTEAQQ